MNSKIRKYTVGEGLHPFLSKKIFVFFGEKENSYIKTPPSFFVYNSKVYKITIGSEGKFYSTLDDFLLHWSNTPKYGYFEDSIETEIEVLQEEASSYDFKITVMSKNSILIEDQGRRIWISFTDKGGRSIISDDKIELSEIFNFLCRDYVFNILCRLEDLYNKYKTLKTIKEGVDDNV